MTAKLIVALVALCLIAPTAQASSPLAVSLVPDFSLPASCPDQQDGFGLQVASLGGRALGTGQTCIRSSVGCETFEPWCRRTVRSTLTLDLARGSLTARLTLLEVLPSFSSLIQAGSGEVSAGTGIYARATGRVAGGGAGSFDDAGGFTGRIVYVCDLHGVAG